MTNLNSEHKAELNGIERRLSIAIADVHLYRQLDERILEAYKDLASGHEKLRRLLYDDITDPASP